MTDYIATVDETLIEALYMAGNDARHWKAFLKHALKMFNVQLAIVHIFSPGNDDPLTYMETERREAVPDNVLRSHLAALAAHTRQGISLQDNHSLTLVVHGRLQFGMTLVRDATRPSFTVQGREGLDSLAPFVAQVMNAPSVRSTAAIDLQYLQALNSIAMPCLLLGRAGGLVFCNDTANELLARGRGLRREGSDLRFDNDANQALFEEGLRTCDAPVEIIMRPPGQRPILAVLAPLQAKDHNIAATLYLIEAGSRPMPGAGPPRLCSVYGLTLAEAEIALLILSGHNAAQIAIERKVSLHTVRAQIKQILDKTHSRRQSDLFKLQGFFNA